MSKPIILQAILLATALGTAVPPQNGDIRLADGSSVNIGRLEVFFNDVWGTVCYNSDSIYTKGEMGAARAACRQLGYQDQFSVGTVTDMRIPPAPATTPTLLYEVDCAFNDVTDLNNELEHILRCNFYTEGVNCSHSQDMAIQCLNVSKYSAPYDSEVRLVNGGTGYPSSGVVEIYLNNHWGTVCADNLNWANTDSVCRQMDYTDVSGSTKVDKSLIPDAQPILNGLTCEDSYNCLSSCFSSYPSSSDTVTCDAGQIMVVNCTFNLDTDGHPGGSESVCTPFPTNTIVHLAEIIAGVVGGICVVAAVIVIALCCCCFISGCPLNTWRDRRLHGYNRIN